MLEIRGAHPEELNEAAQVIALAFHLNHGDTQEMAATFLHSLTADTVYNPENTRIALVDGQVVSVMQVADRQMLISGVPVRMGVLLWVGTHPEYCGRGAGSLLLWDTRAYLRAQGYPLSLIFGAEAEPFYERAGWRSFAHLYKNRLTLPNAFDLPDFGGELRAADLERDLPAIYAVRAEYNRNATGPACFAQDLWREYAGLALFNYPLFYVAERAGRVVAYLRNGYSRAIVEAGMLPDAKEALHALVLFACRETRRSGQVKMEALELPALHHRLLHSGLTLQREPVKGQLYRVMRLDLLLAGLLPQMQARWQAAGLAWNGCLRVESEAGSAALQIDPGGLRLADEAEAAAPLLSLHLTHAQAVDLLFGQAHLPDLWVESRLPQAEILAGLEALFPPREFRWYPKDTF